MYKFGLPFLILLILFSCTRSMNNEKEQDMIFVEDSLTIRIEINNVNETSVVNYSDIYDSIRLVKLEMLEESIIGNVSKVYLTKGDSLLVYDNKNQNVLLFDPMGHFLYRIGVQGDGPHEYLTVEDVVYDEIKDEIVIWDHNKKMLSFYGINGDFIKEIKLPWYIGTFQIVDSQYIAVYMNNNDIKGDEEGQGYNIKIIDRDNGKIVKQLFPYSDQMSEFHPACKSLFSLNNNGLLLAPLYSSTIFQLDSVTTIYPKFLLDFGINTISLNEIRNKSNRDFSKWLDNHPNKIFCSNFFETDNYLVMNLVKNRLMYLCVHDKNNMQNNIASILFNDMYGLTSSTQIKGRRGDFLITLNYPADFEIYKEVINCSEKGDMKKMIIDKISDWFGLYLKGNKAVKTLITHIEKSDLNLTGDEIEFILDIEESDNPILQIVRLKK